MQLTIESRIASIMDLVALLDNPDALQAYLEKQQAAARRRVAIANAKFSHALSCLTDVQSVVVDAYECKGAKINKLFIDRHSGRIAVMLVQRNIWNNYKGKMGTKIIMAYPDGRTADTFEKTISIKPSF